MVTRREVLGAGLALTAISSAIGSYSVTAVEEHSGIPKAATLVLDESLGVSTALVDFLHNRKPDLSLLTIRLDSFASTELKPLLNSARMIAGISSGATLFCLERIAWDYGYRVTRRSEHKFKAQTVGARKNDEAFLAIAHAIISNQPESFAAAIAPSSRGYRPSMTDDTLHAWIMQTAVTSKQRAV